MRSYPESSRRSSSPVPACARAPGALPVLGHALALLHDPLRFLARLPEYGDLVRIRLGSQEVFVACDLELTRQVLQDDRTFDKGGPLVDKAREVIGDGVGTCPHGEHRRQRRLTQPAFRPARLAGYAQTMAGHCSAVTGAWRDGQAIDVLPEMTALTARVTAATMFAAALPPATFSHAIDDLAAVIDGIYLRMLLPPLLGRLPTPGNRRYHRARARLRATIGQVAGSYRADGGDHGDLLSMLAAARDPAASGGAGQGLSDAEVSDQALTFFVAGTEAVAALLAWTLYLLARHPDIQRQLQAEVDTALAGAEPAFEALPRLELTGRILTEALRIYPPGWIFTRTTTADTRLGRYLIPAGTAVAYSPYIIHHRAGLHADPGCFDPGRWASPPARSTLIPFGGGARKCIGDTFAITEATLALAAIARHWHVHSIPGVKVRPRPRTSLAPYGLRLRVTSRAARPQQGAAGPARPRSGAPR